MANQNPPAPTSYFHIQAAERAEVSNRKTENLSLPSAPSAVKISSRRDIYPPSMEWWTPLRQADTWGESILMVPHGQAIQRSPVLVIDSTPRTSLFSRSKCSVFRKRRKKISLLLSYAESLRRDVAENGIILQTTQFLDLKPRPPVFPWRPWRLGISNSSSSAFLEKMILDVGFLMLRPMKILPIGLPTPPF